MRSISVWYFIRMKTGGIFYFVRWRFRHRITSTLLCATEVEPEVSLKNAFNILSSLLTFQDVSSLQKRDTHISCILQEI